MADTAQAMPPPSALQSALTTDPASPHPPHLQHLAQQIAHNLTYQHNWTEVTIHDSLPDTTVARPLISGLPPNRLYVHPDEQIALLKEAKEKRARDASAEDDLAALAKLAPQREWVLPSHLREQWTLRRLAEVMDCVTGRGVLGTVDDDGTIVYYIVHDGIVKPRQN